MKRTEKLLLVLITAMFLATLPGCAKVGSERWCKKMKEKPAADWTARETKDYTKHCVFD